MKIGKSYSHPPQKEISLAVHSLYHSAFPTMPKYPNSVYNLIFFHEKREKLKDLVTYGRIILK
jgi:hypothetical protein